MPIQHICFDLEHCTHTGDNLELDFAYFTRRQREREPKSEREFRPKFLQTPCGCLYRDVRAPGLPPLGYERIYSCHQHTVANTTTGQ